MKATDLMIGDWVMDTRSNTPLRVNPFLAQLEVPEWKPIPLTPEILEKNGFTDCETSDLDREMGNSFWYPGEENYISDSDLMINLMRHSFLVRYNASTISGLHYVHELQHVLNLLKIEKQIVL